VKNTAEMAMTKAEAALVEWRVKVLMGGGAFYPA